jgi:hypothetical protein
MLAKLLHGTLSWFACSLVVLSLVACESEPALPLQGGIPRDEIVFMPDGDPIHTKNNGKTLGFVNPDGTGKVEFTFRIVGGSRSNFGERYSTQQVDYPRWSRSGDMLMFSIRSAPPNIRIIDNQGMMYGRSCDIVYQAFTFDSRNNILGTIYEYSPIYEKYKNEMTSNATLIARYDLLTCAALEVFSLPVPQDSLLGNIGEADNGLITAQVYNDPDRIIIYNPMSKASVEFPGYYPSLSHDGKWLAYYSLSGNLMVRDTQNGTERAITKVFSANYSSDSRYLFIPGWSPDEKWLVYNTPNGKIYKVNIETGENVYITDGWAPDWRP